MTTKFANTFRQQGLVGLWKRYWGFALGSYVVVKVMPPRVIKFVDDKHTTWKRLEHVEGFFLTRVSGHKKIDHSCNDDDDFYGSFCDCGWFDKYSLRRRKVIHHSGTTKTKIAIPNTFKDMLLDKSQQWIEIPRQ